MTRRRGGELSITFPTSFRVRSLSLLRCSHLEPGFQSDTFSCCQYFAVILGSMSAFQIFSGDVEM